MIWGCINWKGIEFACRIEGRMNGELYEEILKDELMNSLDWYCHNVKNIIFQQDNDSKHTCKRVQKWFDTQGIKVLQWPAQSPDLNPIEHLWFYLKKRVRDNKKPAEGKKELWERTQIEWEKISKEKCQELIESMPRRIAAVLKAKGGYTRY